MRFLLCTYFRNNSVREETLFCYIDCFGIIGFQVVHTVVIVVTSGVVVLWM